jgi:His-Xaa-Ser system radical SAM maturase HxsC
MLPLRTSAQVHRVTEPVILKVVGLADFAAGRWAPQRMLLDTRDTGVGARLDDLLALPWGGVLTAAPHRPHERWDSLVNVTDLDIAEAAAVGDVVRLSPGARYVQNLYRRGASSNTLFITERCNNFCLMCSQPPRDVDDDWRIAELFHTIELMDQDLPWLGITGGEPTLIGSRLADLMAHCADHLPTTGLHVLTNGRRFADTAFTAQFRGRHPKTTWAVPLYGDTAALHDYVVQAKEGFAETVRGLYALHRAGQSIEIRIVLQKPTAERLPAIAEFILRSFPFVDHIALMGLEPTGFARANREALWIDPADYTEQLSVAIDTLHGAGLRVSIYNLPLCVLPVELWPFSRQSISDWKQHHLPLCASCSVKDRCGGFFASHTPQWQSRKVHALVHQEQRS